MCIRRYLSEVVDSHRKRGENALHFLALHEKTLIIVCPIFVPIICKCLHFHKHNVNSDSTTGSFQNKKELLKSCLLWDVWKSGRVALPKHIHTQHNGENRNSIRLIPPLDTRPTKEKESTQKKKNFQTFFREKLSMANREKKKWERRGDRLVDWFRFPLSNLCERRLRGDPPPFFSGKGGMED